MTKHIDTLDGRILIVDDDTAAASMLEGILRSEGYGQITLTTNPCEVGELHREHRYDLILLDVSMPALDGFGVIEALKEIDPHDYLPVILLTDASGHRLRALQVGVQAVLVKPFEIAEVRARVRNMLEVRLLRTMNDDCNAALVTAVQERDLSLEVIRLQTSRTVDQRVLPDSIVVAIDAVVRPLVPAFLSSRRQDVTTLTTALTALDFATIATLSQGIVETGRSYGFDGLTHVGRVIEAAAEGSDEEAIRLGINQLSGYLARVRVVNGVE